MTADLDAELEQATRQAFARMFGVIEVTPPEEMPDMSTTTLLPLDADGAHGHQPRRRPHRNVVLAAAACAAVAAAVAAVIVLPDRSSPDRVSTTTPSSTAPATTTSSTAPTTSSTASTSLPTSTVPDTAGGTGQGGVAGDGWPGSGEVRAAERRGLLDPATGDVPLDGLTDVVDLRSANWPVVLQAVDDGEEVALQLTVPGDPSYGAGIEGTPHQLQTHWMVNAVDNQFVVWGLVPAEIASVTIYTRDGQAVPGETVPAGPPALQSRAFAVILPQLAYIEGASGELADGTVSLAGVELEASLAQFQQHSPLLREWTGFIPVVRH